LESFADKDFRIGHLRNGIMSKLLGYIGLRDELRISMSSDRSK
jgi:hypothetical protein